MEEERTLDRFGQVVLLSEARSPLLSALLELADNSLEIRGMSLNGGLPKKLMGLPSVPSVVVVQDVDFARAVATVRAIRRIDEMCPVLVVTAERDSELLLQGYQAGANDCVGETITPALLMAKARVWLRWAGMAMRFSELAHQT